jgi:hypothetical protein
MSDRERKALVTAREYIGKHLESVMQYGSAPDDFSDEEYWRLVEEIAETIKAK